MEIRAREVLLAELDFEDDKGVRKPMGRARGYSLYRHYVKLEMPTGGFDTYTNEELELLLRLTERMDAHWKGFADLGTGLFYADTNFISFGKWIDDKGVPWMWQCARQSWREGTTKPTLAEGLSRFYMGDLMEPGFWVCGPDFVACQVTEGESHSDKLRLANKDGVFHWSAFPLAAPLRTELDELIDLYRRERAAQGKPHFPLLLKQTG